MSAADRAFASIRAGLDKYFPNEPYLTDATLSETLGMTQMTLANRRSMDPAKYPTPLKLGGARTGVHPRAKFIDWLAREELAAKAGIAHRCRRPPQRDFATDAASANGADHGFPGGEFDAPIRTIPRCK